jgi:hypothetical protein
MLETHLAGKTTEKRENFDPSTLPASTENLHFTLNRKIRRAHWLPAPATSRQPPTPRQLGKTWTRLA